MDFKAKYKRSDYLNFFRNYLLPEDFDDQSEDVSIGFNPQHISKAIKIGEVPSLELNIYEVTHPAENDPRVSLSRDAFRLLAQYGVRRALVVFNSESSSNFRLSLVTIDLKWEEGKRVQKEYSNPRRYSFFLGPETKTHTPEEYLIKQGRVKDFKDLKNRFSIEIVNKDFYTQIAVLFTQLAGGKRTIGRKSIDAGRGLLNLPSTVDDTLDKEFTVRLIGRLVFCWFLKKKRSDKNIPLLPEELLSSEAVSENKGYYHGILEPLFFEVLNEKVDKRQTKFQEAPWAQIPFLNGGLFTPHHHDFYEPGPLGISKHINTLKVPDQWIKELFEVFEVYNFTIDENTSVDVELSIEPEMLGRIFENLLAEINPETGETARKATGSYYTPRPIVEYMVDESLKQYLLTKTKLDEAKIKSLLTYEALAVKLTDSERESVLVALDAVKVIDPACGSGAFPMGILQKMLLILQKVDPESEWWLERKLSQIESKLLKKELGKKLKSENVNYVHKLGIIQGSIYGVDIQPIAVEISKLRFFLSLIVDEKVNDAKENRGVEPLPNLEFKFVCTNSLIGLPKQGKSSDQLFETEDTQSINELKDLRDEYLRSSGIEKEKIQIKFLKIQKRMVEFYWQRILKPQTDLYGNKRELKKQEEPEFTRMLSSWDPFSDEPAGWFDPEWMFGIKEGFDIVIANPPYGIVFEEDIKKKYEIAFPTFKRNNDIYVAFMELGVNLLSDGGLLTYINPNTYQNGDYFIRIRQLLATRLSIIEILDFKNHEVFCDPTVFVSIFIGKKDRAGTEYYKYGLVKSYSETISKDSTDIKLSVDKENIQFKPQNPILIKIFSNSSVTTFDALFYVKDVGFNYWTIGKGKKRDGNSIGDRIFYSGQQQNKKDIRFLKGRNVARWRLDESDNYLRHNYEEYLKKPVDIFRFTEEFMKISPKIVYRQTASKIIAAIDTNQNYLDKTVHIVVPRNNNNEIDLRYALALLNSKLYQYLYSYVSQEEDGRAFAQVKTTYLKKLPFKIIPKEKQKLFVEAVKTVCALANERSEFEMNKADKSERCIDQLVYDLYDLGKEEIAIVEEFCSKD